MNTRGQDRWRSGSSDLVGVLTIPFRIRKGKSVACLAWEHAGLAGQKVGKADPAAGVPDPTMTEATKAPEGGAGEAWLSNGAETERPNPPWLRHEADRCRADLVLGRSDLVTVPGDVRWGGAVQ
jgi:hypothetical protein